MGTPPATPHDKLFRALLDDPERARGVLADHLPAEIVATFADTLPVVLDGTYIDEALQGSQSDRLFQVALADGRSAYVYALLEHKSTPDPRTPIQLLTYMARIWDRHLKRTPADKNTLPAIIPMVIYHGRQPWTVPLSMLAAVDAPKAIRDQMAGLGYILRDLGPIEDADLARDMEVRSVLMTLKHAFDQGVPLEMLVAVLVGLSDGSLLERQVLEYMVRVYNMTEAGFEEVLELAKPQRREELMGTVAEEWMKRGEARGEERGKAEGLAEGEARGEVRGKAEGKATLLLHMLERRFGVLPSWAATRVREAGDGQLDAWADSLFDATSLEDVLGAGPRH